MEKATVPQLQPLSATCLLLQHGQIMAGTDLVHNLTTFTFSQHKQE